MKAVSEIGSLNTMKKIYANEDREWHNVDGGECCTMIPTWSEEGT